MSPRMQEAHEQEKIVMQYFVIKKRGKKSRGKFAYAMYLEAYLLQTRMRMWLQGLKYFGTQSYVKERTSYNSW